MRFWIAKHLEDSAGSVRVEVVFLASQVVVIQAFEGRAGVEEEVA